MKLFIDGKRDGADDWQDTLSLLPGYDPFAQADGCWFDPDIAQLFLDFFPACLTHIEGDLIGQPFKLEPWQKSWLANLFGWQMTDEVGRPVRRFRESLLYVARKNGKTPLAAGVGIAVLSIDGEGGQQDFIAADKRENAAKLFRHCKGMVNNEPELARRFRIYGGKAESGQSRSIVNEKDASFLRIISTEGSGEHGGNTHLAMVDELHAQPNRELVDVLTTSTASLNRKQPLLILITTADYQRPSICNEKYDYAQKVRDNSLNPHAGICDQRFLPAVWEAPMDADWRDENTWALANPNLGVSVSLAYLRRECKKACDVPAYENTFRRLHVNQKTEQDKRAIPMEQWLECGRGVDPVAWRAEMIEAMRGKPCVAGLDLGSTNDLNALVLLFDAEQPAIVLPFFWVTQSAVARRKRNRVPYEAWVKQGFMKVCSNNSTDYDMICADTVKLASEYQLRSASHLGKDYAGCSALALDRLFQGQQVENRLNDLGLSPVPFGQGFISMAVPVRRLLEMIAEKAMHHGNNPVLTWHAGNASARTDPAGCMKFDKEKSGDKIDGIVALTMAVGLSEQSHGASVYETRGIELIGDEPAPQPAEPARELVPASTVATFGLDWPDEDDD